MKQRVINIFRNIAPPLALNIYRRLSGKGGFYGNFRTWEEARKACSGYDSDAILNGIKKAALMVRNGEAAYERDSVLFDSIQYSWHLLAWLLWIASRNGNRLSLLDFGGSLGTSYFQNIKFLNHLHELHWSVVEQEKFVKCGRESFENKQLRFYSGIDECVKDRKPNVILFSGTVQYLERPYAVLAEALEKGFRHILFDRTPFLDRGEDRITVQVVPREMYQGSYPAWFFSLDKFRNFFSAEYETVAELDIPESFDLGEIRNSRGKGFMFCKRGT